MNQIPIGKNDDTRNDAEGITQQEDGFARHLENLDRQIAEHGPDFAFSATTNERSEDLEAAAYVIRMLERIRRSSDLPSSLSFSNEGGSALPEEEPANLIEDANAPRQ